MNNLSSTNAPEIPYQFLSLPEERLLLASRMHWITMLPAMLTTVFLMLILYIAESVVFTFLAITGMIFLIASLLTLTLAVIAILSIVAAWYFHVYIVTSRKILEIKSLPFFYHKISEVLLDQVRCTEVDVEQSGFLQELLHIGNITITFDRPTHQEAFTLFHIQKPETIGVFLGDNLVTMRANAIETLWHKRQDDKKFQLLEEIFPHPSPINPD